MSAPVIDTIRPGVAFTPAAAASFRRVENDLGRRVDVNSTYREYSKQLSMYLAWNRYMASGYKLSLYPGHSRAIHPDLSAHCLGLGLDSDDWVTPGFIEFMAERGWIRTAASDPTERHHFEYQSWRDKHINRPAGMDFAHLAEDETQEEDTDMPIRIEAPNRGQALVAPNYFRQLSPNNNFEEVNAANELASKALVLTDARFDTIRDLLTTGHIGTVSAVSIVQGVLAGLPTAGTVDVAALTAAFEAAFDDDFAAIPGDVLAQLKNAL